MTAPSEKDREAAFAILYGIIHVDRSVNIIVEALTAARAEGAEQMRAERDALRREVEAARGVLEWHKTGGCTLREAWDRYYAARAENEARERREDR